MNSESQMRILEIIYNYYGVEGKEFNNLLKNREKRFLILLLLKNNSFFNNEDLINVLGISSTNQVKYMFRKAEEKFLINSFFRKEYMKLEVFYE